MGPSPRRRFLLTAAAAAAHVAARGARAGGAAVLPRVNGGMNFQPVRRYDRDPFATSPLIEPELALLQLRSLYELGFSAARVTISYNNFGPDFLASIPYVRAARALGIDVLGILSQHTGFDLLQALSRPETRRAVLRAYLAIFAGPVAPATFDVPAAGRFALQVLNEPTHFHGIPPEQYVQEYLAPVYEDLKRLDPALTVVAAAELGNMDGLLRLRAMFEHGLEDHCDVVAYHVYSRKLVPHLAGLLARRPVWVTETGAEGVAHHLPWVREAYPEIRRAVGPEEVFWFQLFDFDKDRYRLVDIVPDGPGYRSVVESAPLVEHLRAAVLSALGPRDPIAFDALVPDLRPYLATTEDLGIIEQASASR